MALLVAAFQASAATAPASAANACKRYGTDRPGNLTPKHARAAVTCLVNRKRKQNGRGELRRDGRLVRAASRHSTRMRKQGCFSHQCPGEASPLGRLKSVGYVVGGLSRWAYGENIAWGQSSRGTPKRIVRSWMRSSSHRANILSGTFRELGAGYSRQGSRGYYTVDFGLRVR
jgi:uncharacterized protein YkwD